MKHKWFRRLLYRRLLVALIILLQFGFLVYAILSGSRTSQAFTLLLELISLAAVLYIIAAPTKGAYKLTWVILILSVPIFGGLFYLMFSMQSSTRIFRRAIDEAETIGALPINEDVRARAEAEYPSRAPQLRYLQSAAAFGVFENTETKFYPLGEDYFHALVEELEKAEKYIFLEYFIIEHGKMWDTILEILVRKAKSGVTVRLLYDDIGCFILLPRDYVKRMREVGIECRVFNRFRPMLTVLQNNRDHRKICAIDGKVAFTGGINLADEYINEIVKYGHWKDSGVRLYGDAAMNMSLMFLRMWRMAGTKEEWSEDFSRFVSPECTFSAAHDGYVIPYSDSPLDNENVGEHIYLQLINSARNTLYICTPYLIIDENMLSALILAAKSGVDVRIITPHVWDKRLVHATTRSYYNDLISAGVRVFEYTPGFMHEKLMICDGEAATVGTTNLDFRSLYMHFECGVLLYGCRAVREAQESFMRTLESSREITAADCKSGMLRSIGRKILRLFAPLM